VEIQALEKVIDDTRPPAVTVDTVEYIARGLHRQRGDFGTLAVSGNCHDAGSDADGYCFELAQLVHHGIDLPGARFLRVENGLGIVEDDEHLRGGKGRPQGCEVLGIFDPNTDDLRQSGKEMSARSRKLIATNKSAVIAKSFFDPTVVEDGERNRCFPDPPCTNEGDGFEVFSESDHLLDQLLTSEAVPRSRGRRFTNKHATVEMSGCGTT
jgi:hypothetical protein